MKAYIIITAGGNTTDANGEGVDNLQVLDIVQADTALAALLSWKDSAPDTARAFSESSALIYELAGVTPVTLPIVSEEEIEADEPPEECGMCSGTGKLNNKPCPNCAGHGTK